jgi:PIN domain
LSWDWWESRRNAFQLFISEAVLEETAAGDSILAAKRLELLRSIPVLPLNGSIIEVAESLVREGAIPRRASVDALHIAVATVYECEYLLTWNCRHIANAEIQRTLRLVLHKLDLDLPTICTPEELMGE